MLDHATFLDSYCNSMIIIIIIIMEHSSPRQDWSMRELLHALHMHIHKSTECNAVVEYVLVNVYRLCYYAEKRGHIEKEMARNLSP